MADPGRGGGGCAPPTFYGFFFFLLFTKTKFTSEKLVLNEYELCLKMPGDSNFQKFQGEHAPRHPPYFTQAYFMHVHTKMFALICFCTYSDFKSVNQAFKKLKVVRSEEYRIAIIIIITTLWPWPRSHAQICTKQFHPTS